MDWQEELISLYLFVDKEYQQKLHRQVARISNYSNLAFSDEEALRACM